ncbi:cell wall-binding repeat-containing protein [Herbiconiux sp. CPCC 205716]|uniref:Cell wall-binding repeat-containing protein n=1 Tax=Herbiconiux gentiana TaxID=2970912 RepID=A0ABT2GIB4_9MICO|nr:cell wall-binding repeat-containing protein [Herbiconiux gentiana]MCS5715970.1 cell wall-binding repeat-containing protein [Herbiconiux gentiana]
MRTSLRTVALVTAVTLGLSFGATTATMSASADEGAGGLTVEGLVRVVPREAPPIVATEPTTGPPAAPDGPDGFDYAVITDGGASMPLADPLQGARLGDRVQVELALPDAVLDQLSAPVRDELDAAGTTADPSPELLTEVAAAAVDDGPRPSVTGWTLLAPRPAAPDDVAETAPSTEQGTDSTAETTAATAAAPAKPHLLNVVVLAQPGENSSAEFPTSVLDRIVKNLGLFWVQQSAGQISSLAASGGYKRITVASCDPSVAWSKGAAAFGSTEESYWSGTRSTPTHLVVIASEACGAGTGLGTVGTGIHDGGEIWAVVKPVTDESQVMAHEFGHNISLGHSNSVQCPDAPTTVDTAPPCYDAVYDDYYDVMAGGFRLQNSQGDALATTEALAALNVTHRVHLGVLAPGRGLQTVALPSGQKTATITSTLAAASSTSGTRGIVVTDPRSGDPYYLEYRSGTGTSIATGRDAESYYNTIGAYGYDPSYGVGVRVLRLRLDRFDGFEGVDESSAALLDTAGGDGVRHRFLAAGDSLSTDLGGLTVSVGSLGSASATVTISLGAVDVSGVTTRDRLSGADRYGTAIALSKAAFPSGAPVVYLATGTTYPDALAAGPAASKQGGPLLLTTPGALPSAVRAELARLDPDRIVVVGGVNSVSAAVADAAKTIAPVTRLSGADRYATGRAIVAYAFPAAPSVFVATGANFPDALSAGAAGAKASMPVVLVNGAAGVDSPTRSLLEKLGTTDAAIVGGPLTVSYDVEAELQLVSTMQRITRLAGDDRYATSSVINRSYFSTPTARVMLASGSGFADALAGGPVAARFGAPLFVVQPDCVATEVLAALDAFETEHVTLVGGTTSLSERVRSLTPC